MSKSLKEGHRPRKSLICSQKESPKEKVFTKITKHTNQKSQPTSKKAPDRNLDLLKSEGPISKTQTPNFPHSTPYFILTIRDFELQTHCLKTTQNPTPTKIPSQLDLKIKYP